MTEVATISMAGIAEILAAQQKMFAEQMAEMNRQNAEQTKALIAELKKPSVMEQRQLDIEEKALLAKNEERKANAEAFRIKKENQRWVQANCTHTHADGNTHCVWVQERSGPGYILCQMNQCIIRPGVRPANDDSDAIYDTAQFNRLFQSLPSQELFG